MAKYHELIKYKGKHYAEVIRSKLKKKNKIFLSPAKSSFQFGILAHEKGFVEPPHYHRPFKRIIKDLQQMFIVQKGKVQVDLYSDKKYLENNFKKRRRNCSIHGIHAIKVLEDMQCISVKQGPFLGPEFDKVIIKKRK